MEQKNTTQKYESLKARRKTDETKPCNCEQLNNNLGLGFVKCDRHDIHSTPQQRELSESLFNDTKAKAESEIYRKLSAREQEQLKQVCNKEALFITAEHFGEVNHVNELINNYGIQRNGDLILRYLNGLSLFNAEREIKAGGI